MISPLSGGSHTADTNAQDARIIISFTSSNLNITSHQLSSSNYRSQYGWGDLFPVLLLSNAGEETKSSTWPLMLQCILEILRIGSQQCQLIACVKSLYWLACMTTHRMSERHLLRQQRDCSFVVISQSFVRKEYSTGLIPGYGPTGHR